MKRYAFTLIELLITIAIIAILAAVLLPALNEARSTAHKIRCHSNLKQIGIASAQYVSTFDDYIAPPHDVNNWSKGRYHWDYYYGIHFMDGAINADEDPTGKSWSVFHCPADLKQRIDNKTGKISALPPRSYAMFRPLFHSKPEEGIEPPRASSVRRPASTYFISDCNLDEAAMSAPLCGRANSDVGSIVYIDKGTRVGTLHKNYANFLYLDGHTSSKKHWTKFGSIVAYKLETISD